MKHKYKIQWNIFCASSICLLGILLYVLFYHIYKWEFCIPFSYCAFHDVLHLYCPGCGGTRAIDALLAFRFVDSFLANPIVLYMAAVGMYYYVFAFYSFIIKKNGKIYYKLPNCLIWIALGIVVCFFVLRNVLLIFGKIDYLGDFIS